MAQSWALWHVRNKLTIESKMINSPADIIFKTAIFLQQWTLTAKQQDQEALQGMARELRRLHAQNLPTSPTGSR